MENILDSYKKIVHKAVDLGLLSEENELFYLSSIDQSATINNLDDLLSPQPSAFRNSCKQSINGLREAQKQPITGFCCAYAMNTAIEDALSHETSLKNYSPQDWEVKSTASDSDLDYYHHYQPSGGCRRRSRVPAFLIQRKPRKKDIVDFGIPVVLDIGKKSKKKSKFRADFKAFSSEDVSHDERNTFSKRRFRNKNKKSCTKSKNEKIERSFSQDALEKDLITYDVLYEKCNDFTSTESNVSPKQVGCATEKARGDWLREPQDEPSKELNPQLDIEMTPSTYSRDNNKNNVNLEVSNNLPDTVRVNDRFEVSVSGGGSDYCKMKEVLVVEDAAHHSQPKDKLLQVNIFCQLVPNAASNVADRREDNPIADCDSKPDPSPTVFKAEENKGSIKEKTRRKPTLHMLSKMFSRMTLPSRFNK